MNIPELLQQLPDTDKEIQAKQPPPAETAEGQKRKPKADPWGDASKFTGPDPDLAGKLAAQVFTGGRKTILELIALLPDTTSYKPEYLLHCLAVYAGDKERKLLVKTLASELDSSDARLVLIRELQWIGSDDAVKALGAHLANEGLCAAAASAITAIGSGRAAEQFRKAFPKATGRSRVIIAQNLGVLRDARSVEMLRNASQDTDTDLRLTAGWALARIGDAASVDVLLKVADAEQG